MNKIIAVLKAAWADPVKRSRIIKGAIFAGLFLIGFWIGYASAAVTTTDRVRINLLRSSTTVGVFASWDACRAEALRLANASTATSGTVVYTCQTERRDVVATYSANAPTPPPTPPPTTPPPPVVGVDPEVFSFAETWARNWNYGGHTVTAAFTENYGLWDYTETTYEPWLFDRATVGHRLYELTGLARWRDQFLSDFAWYRAHIDAQGIFTPKGNDDTKYGYVTPFLLYEKLTGDQQYRPIAKRIYDSWVREWSPDFQPSVGGSQLWTEREIGLALEAAVSWYEMTGEATALTRARALVQQWTTAAGSAGAPLITYTQHEGGGPGGTSPTNLTHSPWMSALYFQAARRLAVLSPVDAPAIQQQASRWFDYCDANCFYDAALAHVQYSGLVFPRYLTGELIGDAGYDYGNMGHCLDVAGAVKFARDSKAALGQAVAAADTRLAQMRACAKADYVEWTRTTTYLPKYRLNPPRKGNWMIRGAYEGSR